MTAAANPYIIQKGTGGKSTVRKSFVLDRSDYRLKDPSQERIDEEEPEYFRNCVFHGVSFVISF